MLMSDLGNRTQLNCWAELTWVVACAEHNHNAQPTVHNFFLDGPVRLSLLLLLLSLLSHSSKVHSATAH